MKKSKGSGHRPLLISLFLHLKKPYNPKPKTAPGNQSPPSSRFQTIPQAITAMSDSVSARATTEDNGSNAIGRLIPPPELAKTRSWGRNLSAAHRHEKKTTGSRHFP
ncbi:hypothetical protein B296_00038727 [Ensete ventricosum]|uniref:Uncharacterized protein n=1 Tax=Ensete ventricosum TaxID=4639 RepID=A0A426Y548_ENSVE|nr:hypothetical protein B296_00038727 [Ensete ventricosum]